MRVAEFQESLLHVGRDPRVESVSDDVVERLGLRRKVEEVEGVHGYVRESKLLDAGFGGVNGCGSKIEAGEGGGWEFVGEGYEIACIATTHLEYAGGGNRWGSHSEENS